MKHTCKHLLTLLLAILLCLSMIACNTPSNPSNGKDDTSETTNDQNGQPELGTPVTFVGIDINPSVELTLDENGLVVSVYGSNEDGVILLYGEESNLIGKTYEVAAEHITNLAATLGYLEEGHKISATVTAEDAAAAKDILQKLEGKIDATADALGITVTVTSDLAYALLRDLEALKEKYPTNEAIQALTPAKYKLALSATEGGTLEITAAAEMSNEALIKEVNQAHATVEKYATNLYREAKARAEMTFELAMGVALDGVYNTVYLARLQSILAHPEYRNTFYYGAVYQAYQTTARTYAALEEILKFGSEMTNYELDSATVDAIAEELGLDDTSLLQNEDGKVTLESAIDFAERFLNQNTVSDEVADHVEELLRTAEDAAAMVALSSDVYAADLSALKTQIETIVATVNSTATPFLPLLGTDAKAEFETCLADLNESVSSIALMMEDGLTAAELKELREEAESKAEQMLARIEADLTEAELAQVKALEEQAEATIDRLTSEFSARLDAAESSAKQEIECRREARKNQAK